MITPSRQATRRQGGVITDAYWIMLAVWSDCGSLPRGELSDMITMLHTIPVSTFVGVLKACDGRLTQEFRYSGTSHLNEPTFKQWVASCDVEVKDFAPLTKFLADISVRTIDDIETYRILHQVLTFISRLNIPDREDLLEESLEAYCAVQEGLDLPQEPLLLQCLKDTIECWFPNTIEVYESLYGDWVPKHGNGAVAEGNLDKAQKYLSFQTDGTLEDFDLLTGGLGFPRPIKEGLDRTARVVFVPKSATALRTISAEPAILQFYQQGCLRSLIRYIAHHQYLRTRIDTSWPDINRHLAWEGSFDGSFSTVDLSSASDSVSWALVSYLFRDTPLWPMLDATRSTHVILPDGRRVEQRSFAPMGSALCFPVECIIFSAITDVAVGARGPYRHSSYRVYGDDIVVEKEHTEFLLCLLSDLGFKVNQDKTFWQQPEPEPIELYPYRESCGGEYIHGYDVTPVRIPRNFKGCSRGMILRDGQVYEGLIELANSLLGVSGLGRLLILSALLDLPKRLRPLFVGLDEDGGIKTPSPTNYQLFVRPFVDPITTPGPPLKRKVGFNQPACKREELWFQRTQFKHGKIATQKYEIVDEVEDLRLYEVLRGQAYENGECPLSSEDTLICRAQRPKGPAAGKLTSGWTI